MVLHNRSNRLFRLFAFIGHGTNDSFWFILPLVLPLILRQYDLRYATAGGLLTAYLITIAIFSMLLGKISDHFPRWVFISFGFMAASAGLFAASYTVRLSLFTICILLAAVGVSTYHPVMYAAINDRITQNRGRFFSQFEFSGLLIILFMYALSGSLLQKIAWVGVLRIVSIPGFILGLIFL